MLDTLSSSSLNQNQDILPAWLSFSLLVLFLFFQYIFPKIIQLVRGNSESSNKNNYDSQPIPVVYDRTCLERVKTIKDLITLKLAILEGIIDEFKQNTRDDLLRIIDDIKELRRDQYSKK